MNALRLSALVLLFAACGRPEATCECQVPQLGGARVIECGASACVNGVGYQCLAQGQLTSSVFACPAAPPVTTCTPKTCSGARTVCGPVSDGCGGTLQCGTCSGTDQCMSGQCQRSPCAEAGAVCGMVQGTNCGTCPSSASCSVDQRQCIETVATITASVGVTGATVAGNSLYLSVAQAADVSVVEVNLSTRTRRDLATGEQRLSPLASNGSHLFYASSTGLHRVAIGGTNVESVTGISGSCYSLLADAQYVYCGEGGDPRYGVSSYGIRRLPVTGGVRSTVVSYLNYPSMAKEGNLLFHVGTTDNYASFAVMGVTDLNDMSGQSLVSGGPLGSRFVLADSSAFYFLDGANLTRAPFDNTTTPPLAVVSGLRRETTVADGSAVFAIGEVATKGGLYRLPINGGAAQKIADAADFGGDVGEVVALLRSDARWLIVTSSAVYAVRAQ